MHSESPVPVKFNGQGKDYFRIWIVNVLLSLITLGVYSAWAKVRRMHFFYRHTSLAGSVFDYHGAPRAILKGRIIATALLAIHHFASRSSPLLAGLALIVLMAAMPWLVHRSLGFRLRNSSYRGLRFAFRGTLGQAYRVFLVYPFLTILSCGLAVPWWVRQLKVYQYGNTEFGDQRFECAMPVGRVYGIYALAALTGLGVMALFMLMGGLGLVWLNAQGEANAPLVKAGVVLWIMLVYVLLFFGVGPFIQARLQNAVWSTLSIDEHRFESRVSGLRLAWISISNLMLTVLTLGLFRPFAEVRTLRYRLESITLLPAGGLDAFIQGAGADQAALGEETAEMFDFDLAL